MSNESAIALQVLDLIKGTNIGELTNQVLFAIGGLASATILYFLVMIYLQSKINKKLKEQRSDIDLLIMLFNDQQKKINAIHKVLIPEGIEDKGERKEQVVTKDDSVVAGGINYNPNDNGFFNMRKK